MVPARNTAAGRILGLGALVLYGLLSAQLGALSERDAMADAAAAWGGDGGAEGVAGWEGQRHLLSRSATHKYTLPHTHVRPASRDLPYCKPDYRQYRYGALLIGIVTAGWFSYHLYMGGTCGKCSTEMLPGPIAGALDTAGRRLKPIVDIMKGLGFIIKGAVVSVYVAAYSAAKGMAPAELPGWWPQWMPRGLPARYNPDMWGATSIEHIPTSHGGNAGKA